MARCTSMQPRPASNAELQLCHTAEHIAEVESTFDACNQANWAPPDSEHDDERPVRGVTLSGKPYVKMNSDIYYSAGTALAARTAAGCCTEAALQARGEAGRARVCCRTAFLPDY